MNRIRHFWEIHCARGANKSMESQLNYCGGNLSDKTYMGLIIMGSVMKIMEGIWHPFWVRTDYLISHLIISIIIIHNLELIVKSFLKKVKFWYNTVNFCLYQSFKGMEWKCIHAIGINLAIYVCMKVFLFYLNQGFQDWQMTRFSVRRNQVPLISCTDMKLPKQSIDTLRNWRW